MNNKINSRKTFQIFIVKAALLFTVTIVHCSTSANSIESWASEGRPTPEPLKIQPALDISLSAFERRLPKPAKGNISVSVPYILPTLVNRWIADFNQFYPDIDIDASPPYSPPLASKSLKLTQFINGQIDAAFMTRIMTQQDLKQYYQIHGTYPVHISIAMGSYAHFGFVDTLAIIVNKKNTVDHISMDQLCAIFSIDKACLPETRPKTWGDIGAEGKMQNIAIKTVGAPNSKNGESARAAFFREKVFPSKRIGDWIVGDESNSPSPTAINEQVANNIGAIGFIGTSYLQGDEKVIAIASESLDAYYYPTYENVLSGDYPLIRNLYMIVHIDKRKKINPLLCEFITFILSRNGQQAVLDNGIFLPLRATTNYLESLEFINEHCD